ncbi:hypothetical protein ACHAPT_012851 [Fusarium lateritium]
MSGAEAAVVLPLIQAAAEFGYEFLTLDGGGFSKIAERIKADLAHARSCREAMESTLCHNYQLDTWISRAITDTSEMLDKYEKRLLKVSSDDGKSKTADKVKYMFQDQAICVEQERALKYCHSTLLTAISVMHYNTSLSRPAVMEKVPKASSMPPKAFQDADSEP